MTRFFCVSWTRKRRSLDRAGSTLDLFRYTAITFARCEEQIRFEAVLARVEVEVTAPGGVELLVCAALEDPALFDDQYLIGAADCGEAMRDDEGRSTLHEVAEAVLNHCLALRVERACRLVEDENAGVGEDGAGDGEALPLTAG